MFLFFNFVLLKKRAGPADLRCGEVKYSSTQPTWNIHPFMLKWAHSYWEWWFLFFNFVLLKTWAESADLLRWREILIHSAHLEHSPIYAKMAHSYWAHGHGRQCILTAAVCFHIHWNNPRQSSIFIRDFSVVSIFAFPVGIQGINLFIDDNCDAEGNYTLLGRQREVSKKANFSMNPIGIFLSNATSSGALPVCNSNPFPPPPKFPHHFDLKFHEFFSSFSQSLRQLANATIEWIHGKLPLDEPECGYNNDKCQGEPGLLFYCACLTGSMACNKTWK